MRIVLILALLASAATVLPAAPPAAAAEPDFALGSVSLEGAPFACHRIPGHTCQAFKVTSCPGVSADVAGEFSVSPPPNPHRGVLVIFTPGNGTGYWADLPNPDRPSDRWKFLNYAVDHGFQVAQVSWTTSWRDSLVGETPPVGPARLACRPATIARYLYEQQWAPLGRARIPGVCGFCILGGSGASAQVTYPLTHYGADGYLDAILAWSGPTHASMAKTCGRVREQVDYWGSAGNDLDSAYGFTSETGPCAQHDPGWTALWNRDSVATQGSDYVYPSTRVHLLLGKLDHVQVLNATDFASRLSAAGTPFVTMHVVPGMGHALSAAGYDALEDALIWDATHGMAACDNGIDDDEDGLVDFAGTDPGCTGPTDRSEREPGGAACDDGVDQDGDGKVDFPDEQNGCTDPLDTDERAATEPCDNGLDDDGDGAADFPDDFGCANPNDAEPPGSPEQLADYPCDDGLDNDGDTMADFPADPDCASAVADGEGVVTPLPSLSVTSISRNEGTGGNALAVLSLTLSSVPQREVRVNFAIGGGTATAGSDYVARSGTVVWDPQTLALQRLAVVVIGDAATEDDETVSVTLSAPVNATLASTSASVTLLDDDEPSSMTIAAGNAAATETDPGQTTVKCNVKATLSATPAASVSVKYATAPGTAAAGTDYTTRTGNVSWQGGTTKLVKSIAITLVADDVTEGTEAFYVDLFEPNPANIGISPSRATCTITDDDAAAGPTIKAVSAATTEADPGQTTARCTLKATLSTTPSTTVTVNYATTSAGGGTAVAGTDYTPKSGTFSWPSGAANLSKTIAVPVLSDNVDEGTETFFLDLSNPNPSSWTISPSRATCTITDDD